MLKFVLRVHSPLFFGLGAVSETFRYLKIIKTTNNQSFLLRRGSLILVAKPSFTLPVSYFVNEFRGQELHRVQQVVMSRMFSMPRSEVVKNYMLNSAEHEILNACKYKIIKKCSFFQAQVAYNAIFPAHKC